MDCIDPFILCYRNKKHVMHILDDRFYSRIKDTHDFKSWVIFSSAFHPLPLSVYSQKTFFYTSYISFEPEMEAEIAFSTNATAPTLS